VYVYKESCYINASRSKRQQTKIVFYLENRKEIIRKENMKIKALLLDFGGVIAEEGFQQGLYAIAEKFGLDKKRFFQLANEAVYDSGYVTGKGTEKDYWNEVRQHSGITAPDEELRQEILSRFIPRDWMLDTVRSLKQNGVTTAILSDQSDWLDQLDSRYHFFQYFDAVFNSYHLGKTKRNAAIFVEVLQALKTEAGETLFVDDNIEHIDRAVAAGLQTHLYESREGFLKKLGELGLQ
jgi:putative hydrolase of the HAD superfamily